MYLISSYDSCSLEVPRLSSEAAAGKERTDPSGNRRTTMSFASQRHLSPADNRTITLRPSLNQNAKRYSNLLSKHKHSTWVYPIF